MATCDAPRLAVRTWLLGLQGNSNCAALPSGRTSRQSSVGEQPSIATPAKIRDDFRRRMRAIIRPVTQPRARRPGPGPDTRDHAIEHDPALRLDGCPAERRAPPGSTRRPRENRTEAARTTRAGHTSPSATRRHAWNRGRLTISKGASAQHRARIRSPAIRPGRRVERESGAPHRRGPPSTSQISIQPCSRRSTRRATGSISSTGVVSSLRSGPRSPAR